jgi:hypothetical protein
VHLRANTSGDQPARSVSPVWCKQEDFDTLGKGIMGGLLYRYIILNRNYSQGGAEKGLGLANLLGMVMWAVG